MKAYIVMIVCTMDDVIVGCYETENEALDRAAACLATPEIRYSYEDSQSVDTEPVLVRVMLCEGQKTTSIIEANYSN